MLWKTGPERDSKSGSFDKIKRPSVLVGVESEKEFAVDTFISGERRGEIYCVTRRSNSKVLLWGKRILTRHT